jgi:type VI secretion system secreted protein Hcp
MAADIFLKLDGIDGESEDDAHKGEIEVLSWSWGATQTGTFHTGSGGTKSKVDVRDIRIKKEIDKSTPNFWKRCCDGKHIKSAVLTCRKAAGDGKIEYLKFTMEPCVISSVSIDDSSGDDRLIETVTLNFKVMKTAYTTQTKEGEAGAEIPFNWDVPGQKEV